MNPFKSNLSPDSIYFQKEGLPDRGLQYNQLSIRIPENTGKLTFILDLEDLKNAGGYYYMP